MTSIKLAGSLIVILGCLAAGAASAPANITQPGCIRDERDPDRPCRRPFVFLGHIDKGDPTNLVFHGGRVTTPNEDCFDANARSPLCVVNMIRRAWVADRMRERFCDSGAELGFRTHDGSRRVYVESDRSMTTSGTCDDQYHVRLWGDTAHGHSTHSWVVGAIHHERRCFVPGFCGHKIDMNWEDVENEAVRQMARHSDNDWEYCVKSDYYPLAGSNPPGKSKSRYRTGYPSRISFQDKDAGCRGA